MPRKPLDRLEVGGIQFIYIICIGDDFLERDPSNCKSYRNNDCGICNSAIAASCEFFEYVPILSDDEWKTIKDARTSIDLFNNREPRFSDGAAAQSAAPVIAKPNYENADRIFAKLKAWRMMKAHEEGVSAFVIFHDSTLTEISRMPPAPKSALLNIRGVGRVKYARYADEIYEILKAEQKERT